MALDPEVERLAHNLEFSDKAWLEALRSRKVYARALELACKELNTFYWLDVYAKYLAQAREQLKEQP